MAAAAETVDTISIDKDLKARAVAAAAEAGVSLDVFVRDAILDRLEETEEDVAFRRLADERWAEFQRTGLAISWEDTKTWLEARARGENPPRPVARKINL